VDISLAEIDSDMLLEYAKSTLQTIARFPMPKAQAAQLLEALLKIAKFDAWRIRLHCLGVLQGERRAVRGKT